MLQGPVLILFSAEVARLQNSLVLVVLSSEVLSTYLSVVRQSASQRIFQGAGVEARLKLPSIVIPPDGKQFQQIALLLECPS